MGLDMTESATSSGAAQSDALNVNARLRELAEVPVLTLFRAVASSPRGLTEDEAADRLRRVGDNELADSAEDPLHVQVLAALRSPFVGLLTVLGVVFAVAGDARGAITVSVMVVLAVGLRVWQQMRSIRSGRALRQLVTHTVTVRRRASSADEPAEREVPLADVVPGDVVLLGAGDLVPADVRILTATDLLVDQAPLSGESLPVPKTRVGAGDAKRVQLVDTPSLCFAGTAVVAGAAIAVVIATGARTYHGSLASQGAQVHRDCSFDLGVRAVGWTLVRFMLVMAPVVFVVNSIVSGVWAQAAMFAVAVAVGLTPEMLPVIVTTNLARGAVRLARDKVIVSRLNAIADLGAIDVLCVDKTGTLTEDRIAYVHGVDATGRIDDVVAEFAYLSVYFQDGPANRLDEAIGELLGTPEMSVLAEAAFTKVDEIAFDVARRRATVVVSRQRAEHILICKGDPDVVLAHCTRVRMEGEVLALDADARAEVDDVLRAYRTQGMRVLAVATRETSARWERYRPSDETDLVLVGFVGFVDPIRDSAAAAVAQLAEHGVRVKMLTGDAKAVAVQVARQVGIDAADPLLGAQIDRLGDRRLRAAAARADVFAELSPTHKARIVAALREQGHAVGFFGDGVNDVAAMRVADAGIASDTATDVAKQSADLVLLDKDLAVLARGVVEGRHTVANTMKYVKITASSNFGNVLSVLAASVFLPFLPILPIQLMLQNLLYDSAQLALPWDRVDAEYLRGPQRWRADGLVRFMLIFGTLSSVFDLATFAALWWVFGAAEHPALFHTGWFTEGLLTQLCVVLVLRSRNAPWRASRPAAAVVAAGIAAGAAGVLLPLTPLAAGLRLTPLPVTYGLWLLGVTTAYALAAQLVKKRYLQCHHTWL
jgi:P-type Mg2+ transporter